LQHANLSIFFRPKKNKKHEINVAQPTASFLFPYLQKEGPARYATAFLLCPLPPVAERRACSVQARSYLFVAVTVPPHPHRPHSRH